MKRIVFFVTAFLLVMPLSFGKGHGGHGGHGGGHGGGRSGGSRQSSGGSRQSSGSRKQAPGGSRQVSGGGTKRAAAAGGTARSMAGENRAIVYRHYPAAVQRIGVNEYGNNAYRYNYYEYGAYGYPYYYNYGYNPFFYNPWGGLFFLGGGIMYSPHYSYANAPAQNDQGPQELEGYVVYEHDTITGLVTIESNAVLVESKDAQRNYDYKFKLGNKGLEYVNVYNTDSSVLNMVRIKDGPKKMMRIVHEGRLNVYDANHGFIYKPEDIDAYSLTVVYNGVPEHIGSSSTPRTKLRLTEYVNKAYGLELNPNDFSWKELLVYMDKLD